MFVHNFFKHFGKNGRIEIGRQLEIRDLSSDLYIGITLANLREFGKTPSAIDLFIKYVNGVAYKSTFI